MDDLEREAHLTALQVAADGPRQNLELRECSRGKALACAVLGVVVAPAGIWLVMLPVQFGLSVANPVAWTLWACALVLIGAGFAAIALAVALARRHGQRVLALTPDKLAFANSTEPLALDTFDSFEIDQRHLSSVLTFSVAVHARAPLLEPACFRSLMAPDAWPVAGGLRVKLWVCALSLDGQRVGFEQLTGLLLAYIEGAQARRTLGQLFPQTVRFDAGR
ncbi:hypothetical protein [Pseudomonas sp. LRF_L74]|uniref:hypothetical protein n=1 Tax=Pseudomonas sp. LRF_L74 TaxID=3369422 RepID=UPI003F62EB06